MKKAKIFLKLWGPVLFWCSLIFYLSSLPSLLPTGSLFFDLILPYLAHLAEFGVLFTLIWRASKNISFSFFWTIVYAFSDEFHQSFVPTRRPSLEDILVDILGMVLAWWGIWKLLPKAPKKLRSWAKKLAVI